MKFRIDYKLKVVFYLSKLLLIFIKLRCTGWELIDYSLGALDGLVNYEQGIDSPHQKALKHSGLTIYILYNLAVMGNRTPDIQMAKSA